MSNQENKDFIANGEFCNNNLTDGNKNIILFRKFPRFNVIKITLLYSKIDFVIMYMRFVIP